MVTVLLSTLALATLPVQAASKNENLPPVLKEIESKYSKAATLIAHFQQVNETVALKQKKTSSGLLMFKRPNKLRWETLKPDPNLLVSDGKNFWFYTPPMDETERGQYFKRKTSETQSRLVNALLSGSFSMARDMKIKKKTDSSYILSPRSGTAGSIQRATIEINPSNKLIEKVTLEHRGGNKSEITLSEIQLGKQLQDDIFSFSPPPNTDRVSE